jgi:hypothetical protein
VQLVGKTVDTDSYHSVGNLLLKLIAMMQLTTTEAMMDMFQPEHLVVLDKYVGLMGPGETISPERMVEDYKQVFPAIFRQQALIALRVMHGTPSAMVDSLLLTNDSIIQSTVEDFFRPAFTDDAVFEKTMGPMRAHSIVIGSEPGFIGECTDADGNPRPASYVDTLYFLNAMRNNKEACDYWLNIMSADMDAIQKRVFREDMLAELINKRYRIDDVSTIVTFNPNWLIAMQNVMCTLMNVYSNANAFSQAYSTYGSYLFNPGAYNQSTNYMPPAGAYAGGGAPQTGAMGYYTHNQHSAGSYYY